MSYVDERKGGFTASAATPRHVFPAYVQTDARAGVRYDSWALNVFVNNLADKRGILARDVSNANFVQYIQPRTVGMSVSKTFE